MYIIPDAMSKMFKGLDGIVRAVEMTGNTVETVSCEPTTYSPGEFPINRTEFEAALLRLFESYAPKRDNSWREYGEDFESDTFWVHCDYQHPRCTCSVEPDYSAWLAANPHAPDCIHTRLEPLVAECEQKFPIVAYEDVTGDAIWRRSDSAMLAVQQEQVGAVVMREAHAAGAKLAGVELTKDNACWSWHYLCTCGRQDREEEFRKGQAHQKPCEEWWCDQPNFFYKPTGFGLHWYKYPCRESYANQPITTEGFGEIIDACIASLKGGSQ